MSGATWLLLNLILVVAAGVTTVGMRNFTKTKLPDYQIEEKEEKQNSGKQTTPATRENRPVSKPPAAASDDIWQKSLFRPDRAEEVATADDQQDPANKVDAQQANADFELVGIARIGLPDKSAPVAIINQKNASNRNARNLPPGARGRPGPGPGRPGGPASASTTPEVKLKHTFKVGDVINQSGYTLTEIDVDKKSVILTRGAERLTLTITMGDDKSRLRKDASVNARLEQQRQRDRKEADARAAAAKARPQETKDANNSGTAPNGQPRPQETKATPKGDPGNNPPPPPSFPSVQGNGGPGPFNRGAGNRTGGNFRGSTPNSANRSAGQR